MTQTSSNWKTIAAVSLTASFAALAFGIINLQTSEAQITGPLLCSVDGQQAIHYDKIVFHMPVAALIDASTKTLHSLPNTPLDVKVVDRLDEVADLRLKVAEFLKGVGLVKFSGAAVNPLDIAIDDVEYAISCEFHSPPG